jgi:hypothetical protein
LERAFGAGSPGDGAERLRPCLDRIGRAHTRGRGSTAALSMGACAGGRPPCAPERRASPRPGRPSASAGCRPHG